MSGTRAKKLRKQIYGDMSARPEGRSYQQQTSGMIVAAGLRREYQWAKKHA